MMGYYVYAYRRDSKKGAPGERRGMPMFDFFKRRTIYRTHDKKEFEEVLRLLEESGYAPKTYTLDSDVPTGCG